jgi:large subunit ribosomal protein L3
MAIGLVGRKRGMTRRFTEAGEAIPVTVIEVAPNIVTQIKTKETDGYNAIQITTGTRRAICMTKPELGHFKKANTTAGRTLKEFRVEGDITHNVGDQILVTHFEPGVMVDVTGTTKGRGFTGTVKRWNFRTQDATHGNSRSHRVPGSTGQNQSPGRTFPGKKMTGHYGNENCTVQTLEVIHVDADRNLLMVKGAVPGPQGGEVIVNYAAKAKREK